MIVLTNPCCCETPPTPCAGSCVDPPPWEQPDAPDPTPPEIVADILTTGMPAAPIEVRYPTPPGGPYTGTGTSTGSTTFSSNGPTSFVNDGSVVLVDFDVEGTALGGDMRVVNLIIQYDGTGPDAGTPWGYSGAPIGGTAYFNQTTGKFLGFTETFTLTRPGKPDVHVDLTVPPTACPANVLVSRGTGGFDQFRASGIAAPSGTFVDDPDTGILYKVLLPEFYYGDSQNYFGTVWAGTPWEDNDVTRFYGLWKATITSSDPCDIGGTAVVSPPEYAVGLVGYVDPRVVYDGAEGTATRCCHAAGVQQQQRGTASAYEVFTGSYSTPLLFDIFAPYDGTDVLRSTLYLAYDAGDTTFSGPKHWVVVFDTDDGSTPLLAENDFVRFLTPFMGCTTWRIKEVACCDTEELDCAHVASKTTQIFYNLTSCIPGSELIRSYTDDSLDGETLKIGEICYTAAVNWSFCDDDYPPIGDFTIIEDGCEADDCIIPPTVYRLDPCTGDDDTGPWYRSSDDDSLDGDTINITASGDRPTLQSKCYTLALVTGPTADEELPAYTAASGSCSEAFECNPTGYRATKCDDIMVSADFWSFETIAGSEEVKFTTPPTGLNTTDTYVISTTGMPYFAGHVVTADEYFESDCPTPPMEMSCIVTDGGSYFYDPDTMSPEPISGKWYLFGISGCQQVTSISPTGSNNCMSGGTAPDWAPTAGPFDDSSCT